MSLPTKYKERTIEYRKVGHSLEETHRTFKVSIATIRKWEKQLKVDPEKLTAYVVEHPDAYQKEIAEMNDMILAPLQYDGMMNSAPFHRKAHLVSAAQKAEIAPACCRVLSTAYAANFLSVILRTVSIKSR